MTKRNDDTIRIIPLGGIDRIGMNMTLIEFKDTIIVIDCGAMFADEICPGAEKLIPDITYLEDNADKVKGILITHGHEDHIGALPFVLSLINVPVYGNKFTIEFIKQKFQEDFGARKIKFHTIKYDTPFNIGDFSIEYIQVNHSVPFASALAITCELGTIVHTGDFKIDFTPVVGAVTNLHRFAELGKQGVLAVLSDSTNALRPGMSPSEKAAGVGLAKIFKEYTDRRLIISTFASNTDRILQILELAKEYHRQVIIDGRSMQFMLSFANDIGYFDSKFQSMQDSQEDSFLDEESLLLVTGSQGEPNASLSKLATQRNENFSIQHNDVVVFSSSIIPGNEKAVSILKNRLTYLGATIPDVPCHSSGHAYADELKLMYALLKPKYVVPIHGEFIHRSAACQLAQNMGYSPLRTALLPDNGYVLELTSTKAFVKSRIKTGCFAILDGGIVRSFYSTNSLKTSF